MHTFLSESALRPSSDPVEGALARSARRPRKALFAAVAAAFLMVSAAVPAGAAPVNIVQDPGFESAGRTGYVNAPSYLPDGVWQQTLGSGFVLNSPANAHSGNIAYHPNGFGGSNATVQQVLTTMPGQAYDLTFYYTFDRSGPLTATFGGAPVAFTTTGTGFFQLGTALGLVAGGTRTTLAFSSVGGNTFLDDVSVTASVPPPTPVPEPAGVALLGTGLLGVGLARQRRRKAA